MLNSCVWNSFWPTHTHWYSPQKFEWDTQTHTHGPKSQLNTNAHVYSYSLKLIFRLNFYAIGPRRSATKQFFSFGIASFEDFSRRGLPQHLKITLSLAKSGYFLHKFQSVRPYSYSHPSAYWPYSHSLTWVNFASMSNSHSLSWVFPWVELSTSILEILMSSAHLCLLRSSAAATECI